MSAEGKIQEEYETLVNPDRDLGPSRIHQITAEEVLQAPIFSEIAGDVAKLLSDAYILAGHNVRFDQNFLIKEYERLGVIMPDIPTLCTCRLMGWNNLAACCQELDIVFEGDQHRAIFDARATARVLHRLIEDDATILEYFPRSRKQWPAIPIRKTNPVTRDCARETFQQPPTFLQKIRSRVHHDTEATPPDISAYLALVDRVLEDRTITLDEENVLADAVAAWGLSISQVKEAHQSYIKGLAVNALADGVVTVAERSDLCQVARLLGFHNNELDKILETAAAQLHAGNSRESSNSRREELKGKRICFTGELNSHINSEPITRNLAEKLAEKAGLVIANSVTKKLDLLVVADPNTQSGKAKKARKYGIRIIAEPVFWGMLGLEVE